MLGKTECLTAGDNAPRIAGCRPFWSRGFAHSETELSCKLQHRILSLLFYESMWFPLLACFFFFLVTYRHEQTPCPEPLSVSPSLGLSVSPFISLGCTAIVGQRFFLQPLPLLSASIVFAALSSSDSCPALYRSRKSSVPSTSLVPAVELKLASEP